MMSILIFLLANLADILLTSYGMRQPGMLELHPLGYSAQMIGVKIVATNLVAIVLILNRRRLGWLTWIPAGIMYAVVIWNAVNILAG